MVRIFFISLITFVTACAHNVPTRSPAEVARGDEDAPAVASTVTYDENCPDSPKNLEEAARASELVRNSKKTIEESVREAQTRQAAHVQSMTGISLRSQSCDDFTKIRQAAETVRGRVLNIDETVKALQDQLKTSQEILNVVRAGITGRNIVCLDYCIDALHKTIQECRQSCGISEPLMTAYQPLLDEESRGRNCRPLSREVSGTLESSHNRMISAAQQSMPATIEAIKKAIKDYMSLRTNYQGEFSRLEAAANHFPNVQCARDYEKWLSYIRNNIRRVYRIGEDGTSVATAFFVDSGTPGQALPVTAVHVARTLDATNDRLEASTLYFDRPDSTDKIDFNQSPEVVDANVRAKVANGQVLNFRVTPQTHDRARDIALGDVRAESRTQFMPVISSDERPRLGQRFTLAGFPTNRNEELTTHDCTFKGYGTIDKYSNERTYLLYCPAAESTVSGMSGGPLLDQNGRVWGVAHAADNAGTNMILVSPLSRSSDGRTRMGIQHTFHSEDCYRFVEGSYEKYSCQIRPNNTEP